MLRSAPMNSCSASSRMPTINFRSPYTTSRAGQGDGYAEHRSCKLRHQADAAEAAERLEAEDAAAIPPHAPHSPCSGHTPSTSSTFQRFWVSVNMKTNSPPAMSPGRQRADRVHHVGAGADRDQPGERTVVHEARIVASRNQRAERAARHRHQRIHRDQAADLVDRLRRHHVEAEPADGQDPRAEREKGNARRRVRGNAAVLVVAAPTRPKQHHGHQRDPAADRVHDDRAGEVVEWRPNVLRATPERRSCRSRRCLRRTDRRSRPAPSRRAADRTWRVRRCRPRRSPEWPPRMSAGKRTSRARSRFLPPSCPPPRRNRRRTRPRSR